MSDCDRSNSITARLDNIEGRVVQLETHRDTLQKRIDELEERLDTLRSCTQYIDDRVDSIFRNLRRLHEFTIALQGLYSTYENI